MEEKKLRLLDVCRRRITLLGSWSRKAWQTLGITRGESNGGCMASGLFADDATCELRVQGGCDAGIAGKSTMSPHHSRLRTSLDQFCRTNHTSLHISMSTIHHIRCLMLKDQHVHMAINGPN
jgi:hypothetical protein